jgi:signal transduction histidine kinase/DNA-binding response OmpR family regulator/ABC-type sugar transport system substrate-binding protein
MAPHTQSGKLTIGVLAGWQFYRTATNLSYLKPIFQGISQAAQDFGCNVLFGCGIGTSAKASDPVRPAWPIPTPDVDYVPISPLNTDGLIVFNPLHSTERSSYVQDLIRSGHPVLFIGSGEPGLTLSADNAGGIFEAVRHLVEHGHRQIAFLAGSQDDMDGDTGERLKAYQYSLEHHGLVADSRIVAFGRHVYDGGYTAIREIMESGATFSAIVSSNDEMALGAMQALKEEGLSIPQDIAIIGFDNRLEGAANEPALSSIHIPLFEMGHKAVDLTLRYINGEVKPTQTFTVETRLVVRESCGCGEKYIFIPQGEVEKQSEKKALEERRDKLVLTISSLILNQSQNLKHDECLQFCQRLVDSFFFSIEQNDRAAFQIALQEVLQSTTNSDDEANIWQDAISLIWNEFTTAVETGPKLTLAYNILDEARRVIIVQMKRQHYQYVAKQRWISSRLSLLTASLINALDEEQIFNTLAQHLPEMDIHFGQVVLFEEDSSHSREMSKIRNIFDLSQPPISFPTHEFPQKGMYDQEQPSSLALIPLVHQSGQLGFAVFGTEHFDLYGAIVQQIAGAINTALLYKQAIEGRQLAEEANWMKSRFLSTISHELRTPLNLIVGLSSMMLSESDDSDSPLAESTHKDIERIYAYSQHLGGLIGDVIDLAASDGGLLRLNFDYVDLAQALRMVAESGNQLTTNKGLSWKADLPESGPVVWGDPTRLRQVVLNLINNAIKFTSAGGVSLSLEQDKDWVTITIRDTGLGIAIEEQESIFDEFWQSKRSVARGYGGLGLGLAITKRLVDAHNGIIEVNSSGKEGEGSTFSISLPVVQMPIINTDSPISFHIAEPRVFILTNDQSSSQRLCSHLSKRGHAVDLVLIHQHFDLLTLLEGQLPDTIIVDLSKDPALGWKVLREIKGIQSLARIPVMLFSSSQSENSLLELDYLTKPIEISELTMALDQHWLTADVNRQFRNVLVVDDEPDTLDMHARVVQAHSAANRVLKARNGKEALDILRREIVDLMILDLQMPEMDGFQLLEVMRDMETTRKIPIIVVTGKVLSEIEMERLNQGVTTVLGKGLFSLEETISHISAALEHKRRISSEAKKLVRQAMIFLQDNFSESISRRDIAKHIGISEDHLTFCFRQELRITPIQYLQRYRINQSKRLLIETDQTITEIAFSVGFSDSGYFSRIFRREVGMPPEVFRQTSP